MVLYRPGSDVILYCVFVLPSVDMQDASFILAIIHILTLKRFAQECLQANDMVILAISSLTSVFTFSHWQEYQE
jgi:hypothetical protein